MKHWPKILFKDLLHEISCNGLLGAISAVFEYILKDTRDIERELRTWPVTARAKVDENPESGLQDYVSVVLPVYDRTSELQESIESVLSQSYGKFELLLVTDGSPKETLNIVEQYRCDSRVRIFHFTENSGTAVRGRNVGIREAKGQFIAFQDSDDIAAPNRLDLSVRTMQETGADIVYGGWRAKVEANRADVIVRDKEEFFPYPFSIKDCFRNNRICHSTVMIRRRVFDDIGGYKPQMKFREDHELWLRAAYLGYRFHPVPHILSTLRIHRSNNTVNFIKNDDDWYRLMLREYKIRYPLHDEKTHIVEAV